MKELTIFILIAIIIISVFTAAFSAVYGIGADEVSSETSGDASDSGYVNIEKELQKISWVYYLLGGLSVAVVAAAAIVITKKKD